MESKNDKEKIINEGVDILASIFVELIDSKKNIKNNKKKIYAKKIKK